MERYRNLRTVSGMLSLSSRKLALRRNKSSMSWHGMMKELTRSGEKLIREIKKSKY